MAENRIMNFRTGSTGTRFRLQFTMNDAQQCWEVIERPNEYNEKQLVHSRQYRGIDGTANVAGTEGVVGGNASVR